MLACSSPSVCSLYLFLTQEEEPLAVFTYCMFPLPRKPAEPLLCKHSQTHTHTLTKQESYTCVAWVSRELSGKAATTFAPLIRTNTGFFFQVALIMERGDVKIQLKFKLLRVLIVLNWMTAWSHVSERQQVSFQTVTTDLTTNVTREWGDWETQLENRCYCLHIGLFKIVFLAFFYRHVLCLKNTSNTDMCLNQ